MTTREIASVTFEAVRQSAHPQAPFVVKRSTIYDDKSEKLEYAKKGGGWTTNKNCAKTWTGNQRAAERKAVHLRKHG